MKIKLKTLGNTHFEIDVDPALTVNDLKVQIETTRPEVGSASVLKLIYKGHVLEDGSILQASGFQDGDFIVVMAAKAKAAAKADVVSPQTVAATTVAPEPALASVAATPAPTELPQGDEQIELLCAMGFAREDVVKCLHAAYDNADRAVEYLTTGIPAHACSTGYMQAGEVGTRASAVVDGGTMPSAPFPVIPPASSSASDLERRADVAAAMEELQSLPNFQEIVGTLQENPASLREMLPALAAERPELFEVISANREIFAELVSGGTSNWGVGRRLRGREGGGFRFTSDELEAVARLQQLGFARAVVIEAYVACEKNEEFTANYLFEHGTDLGGD